MGDMQDCHRMFLQKFLRKGLLNAKEVKQLHKQCCERFSVEVSDDMSKRHLFEFVRTINANIHPFHMEIKKAISEEDGSNHYGLVNISRSDITKMASDYTQNELEFFKKLVEGIVESEDGTVGSIDALNLTEKLEKKITKHDAQELLDRMTREMWIMKKGGRISLDTRAVLELEQYINEHYEPIVKMCNLCKKLALKGQCCDECGIKIHLHCAVRYFGNNESCKCPGRDCNALWTNEVARKDDGDSTQDPQPSQHSRKRKQQNHDK